MKRILRVVGIVFAVMLLILIALPFVIHADQFRPALESRLTVALARHVSIGHLSLALLQGGVSADDLSIADDPAYSPTPFVSAKSLGVSVDLPALIFSRKLNVTAIRIDQPQITLLQSPDGKWNFSSLGAKSESKPTSTEPSDKSATDMSVKLVRIASGRFTMGHTHSKLKPLVLDNVNLELRDLAVTSEFPFSFSAAVAGGGKISLSGKAGPVSQVDVAETPASLTVNVAQLDLVQSGLNEVAPGISGVVSFDGSGQTNGKMLHLNGKLKADKMKLVAHGTPASRPIELDFTIAHDLKKRSGTVRRGDIHLGGAVSSLTGDYVAEGDSAKLNMNLIGSGMAVEELASMLPPMGVALPAGTSLKGGTASLKVAIEGLLDRFVTTGTVSIDHTKLTGFDMPRKMASIERLAGIHGGPDTEIETLSITMKMTPEGMNASEIKLIVPAIGELNGGGAITPDRALNFQMQAAVHTSGFARAINDTPVPFTVEGTCSEPVFKPNFKAVVKEEVKNLGGDVGKAAEGLVKGLFGGKKKDH